MGVNLAGVASAIGGLVPSTSEIVQNVAVSAASGVILAGLKQQMEGGSLDPMGLFHHPANNPNAASGPTASASAFSAMSPAAQSSFLAAGGHVIAG